MGVIQVSGDRAVNLSLQGIQSCFSTWSRDTRRIARPDSELGGKAGGATTGPLYATD
jgi:hypothetical protein